MTAETDSPAPPPAAAPPLSPTSSDESIPAPSLGRAMSGGFGPAKSVESASSGSPSRTTETHPSGKKKHRWIIQVMRGVAFTVYFVSGCLA